MINTKHTLVFLSLATLTAGGCASAGKAFFGHDIDVYGAVQTLRQKEADNVGKYGHLVRGATEEWQIENEPEAKGAGPSEFELSWVSDKAGRVCFETRMRVGNDAEQQRYFEKIRDDFAVVVRSYDSLDQIKPGDRWPEPSEKTLDSVVRRGAPARARWVRKDENLKVEGGTIELCGAAPQIGPQTQYVVAYVLNLKRRERHYPLVWDYKGEPSSRK